MWTLTQGSRAWLGAPGSDKRALLLGAALYLAGVLWRFYYLFQVHPPAQFFDSGDVGHYLNMAQGILDESHRPSIADTCFPPGTGYYLAALFTLDSSWRVATLVQTVTCSLVPLLLAGIGCELFGVRVALLTLAISSFYFPFVDYASYFHSEGPFLFSLVLSFWLLVRSLRSRRAPWAALLGCLSGLTLAAAASFKSVVLLPGLLVTLFLVFMGWKFYVRRRRVALVLGAGLAGLLLLMAPLCIRSTRLNEGRLCILSTNGPLNFLMGHYGKAGHFHFRDEKRGLFYVWGDPAALKLGFSEDATFPFGSYDAGQAAQAGWGWIREHPLEALLLSVQHVFTLFARTIPWPSSDSPQRSWASLFQQLYLPLLLLPACVHLLRQARALFRFDREIWSDVFVLLPVAGIMLAVFATIGDPRYRIPFDGFVILLAARGYTREPARTDAWAPERGLPARR